MFVAIDCWSLIIKHVEFCLSIKFFNDYVIVWFLHIFEYFCLLCGIAQPNYLCTYGRNEAYSSVVVIELLQAYMFVHNLIG